MLALSMKGPIVMRASSRIKDENNVGELGRSGVSKNEYPDCRWRAPNFLKAAPIIAAIHELNRTKRIVDTLARTYCERTSSSAILSASAKTTPRRRTGIRSRRGCARGPSRALRPTLSLPGQLPFCHGGGRQQRLAQPQEF